MRNFKRLLAVGILSFAVPVSAQTITSGTIFESVGVRYNVDPDLLYAIAIVESATGTGDGKTIQPYPYVIRTPSEGAQFFDTKEQANAALNELLQSSITNIDVGMMQRNLRWHPPTEGEDLFDPKSQIEFTASLLSTYLDRSNEPLALRIGRYHTSRHERATQYGIRVLTIYTNLLNVTDQ